VFGDGKKKTSFPDLIFALLKLGISQYKKLFIFTTASRVKEDQESLNRLLEAIRVPIQFILVLDSDAPEKLDPTNFSTLPIIFSEMDVKTLIENL
jgi:hypothetical protein